MKKKTGTVCGFEYNGRKCKSTDIVGTARGVPLCEVHYNTVTSDNVRKFKNGIEITKDMTFTRELLWSETWSRFSGELETEKEVKE